MYMLSCLLYSTKTVSSQLVGISSSLSRLFTFISSTPLVPNLDSTSHNKRHIRSLASSDTFGSSGNFKHALQLII
ncbi:hypothetical protein H5410_063248 [Solanum commersonii]|uniref:Uncharacterized protein n=1 Tax=Solanum commersonii TaxID=4109 RepID=A0A9J5WD13_SOLCO|nr:hypothetical protein H5410_063248 [Solanum commersonii]